MGSEGPLGQLQLDPGVCKGVKMRYAFAQALQYGRTENAGYGLYEATFPKRMWAMTGTSVQIGRGAQRLLSQPFARRARPRAALSATTTTWRCGRREPLGGMFWPRPRRPRHAHSGSKKRGAWCRHWTERRRRCSPPQWRSLF